MKYLPLICLLPLLCSCSSQSNDGVDAEYQRQIDEFNRQTAETDRQLKRSEQQADRFDLLLDKWEQQAERQDRIFDELERIINRGADDSGDRSAATD